MLWLLWKNYFSYLFDVGLGYNGDRILCSSEMKDLGNLNLKSFVRNRGKKIRDINDLGV